MTDHIEDGHKIELKQYFDNFVDIQNEKQILENDLTRLSPCLEMMDCFIARIESIAADATKANEEALDPEDYYVVEGLPTTNDDESIGESSPGSEEQFEVKEEPLDEDEYIVRHLLLVLVTIQDYIDQYLQVNDYQKLLLSLQYEHV